MKRSSNTHHGARRGGASGFVRVGFYLPEIRGRGSSDVESAPVHGHDYDSIGPASAVKVGTDGGVTDPVFDLGGLPGIGAGSIVVPFSHMIVLRESNGSDVRVHLDTTKERRRRLSYYDK